MDKENDPPEGHVPSYEQTNHDLQGEDVGFGGFSDSSDSGSDVEIIVAHNDDNVGGRN